MSSHKPRRCVSQDARSYRPPVRTRRDFSSRRTLQDLRVYSSFDTGGPVGPPSYYPAPPAPPGSCSPAPSCSSGYLSIYSQGSQGERREPLVRQPSSGELWPHTDGQIYSSMAELELNTRAGARPREPELETQRHRARPSSQQRRVRHVYVQTQQPLPPLPPLPSLPHLPWLSGEWEEAVVAPWQERREIGERGERAGRGEGARVCSDCEQAVSLLPPHKVKFQPGGDREEETEEQSQSRIRNFITWVSSKAGQHTSALLDSFPLKGGGKYLQVIMIGLDGAGKTTALYMMKLDQYLNTVPTIGFNCERVKGSIGSSAGTTFLVWDVGGQEKIRPLWRTYTRNSDGIIFVLDAADYRSFEQARVGELNWPCCCAG